jgi:hypothetical protein
MIISFMRLRAGNKNIDINDFGFAINSMSIAYKINKMLIIEY